MFSYSVVVAVYNGEKYIETQLLSIFNQTIPAAHIIVVDDKSKDESFNAINRIVSERNHIRTSVIRNQRNLGYVKTFEKGLKLVDTEYVFFSDQDDFWFEDKVEFIKRIITRNPSIDLVLHDVIFSDSHLHPSKRTKFKHIRSLFLPLKSFVQGSAMAVRTKVALSALPFDSEFGHDNQITKMTSNIFYEHEPLMLYRRHSGNFSITYLNDYQGNMNKLRLKVLWFRIKNILE